MKTENYLKTFELSLMVKYSSAATIKNYMCCVKRFFEFSRGKNMNTVDLIKNYLVWGIKSKEPKTINLHRAAIVCFFKLVKGIDIKVSDVSRKKEFKKLPKIIPLEKIIEAIRKTTNLKHRLQLLLFIDCGIRLSEMATIRKRNIISGNKLWLQDTKGNKERIIPISESVATMLNEFVTDFEKNDLVFGGVCKRTFQKVVSSAFERVGVVAHPHMLRHSFATYQIANGENVFKVQRWMGHGNIKTTLGYMHLSEDMLSKKHDLINGNYTNLLAV